jgi:hypothetical protein
MVEQYHRGVGGVNGLHRKKDGVSGIKKIGHYNQCILPGHHPPCIHCL